MGKPTKTDGERLLLITVSLFAFGCRKKQSFLDAGKCAKHADDFQTVYTSYCLIANEIKRTVLDNDDTSSSLFVRLTLIGKRRL